MSTPTQFFGVPIHRSRRPVATRVPQRPLSALRPLFEAVQRDPVIAAFGWSQSGPVPDEHGRTAGLRIGPPWFRTTTDHAEQDLYALSLDLPHPSLGGHRYGPGATSLRWRRLPYQGPDEERFGRAKRLADALESGAFDRALAESFGGGRGATDVTVWRDRIRVVETTLD
ncbi:hypothetical protein GCM10020229_48710 [Kitasatospora albolonga]|uniref:hypothetical protein n=1 Tax=Kitasatospora albolonga TaxID=68173 RepID=UPI0031EBF3B6